jgi:hypothetical protein
MLEVFAHEQGSPEWFECRRGIPTASMFATVLAKGRDGGDSKGRATYLHKLAGEVITGELAESFSNAHTERGHVHEPVARGLYGFINDVEPALVGFMRNGRRGASPDSLLGDRGILEIKSKLPHLHIEIMLRDRFPSDHRAQVQGQLWIAERDWCDLAVYWPGLPLLVYREHRDEEYLKTLAAAIDAFNEELDRIVDRVRSYGDPDALRRSLQGSVAA